MAVITPGELTMPVPTHVAHKWVLEMKANTSIEVHSKDKKKRKRRKEEAFAGFGKGFLGGLYGGGVAKKQKRRKYKDMMADLLASDAKGSNTEDRKNLAA